MLCFYHCYTYLFHLLQVCMTQQCGLVLTAEHCWCCWSGRSFYLGHLWRVVLTNLEHFLPIASSDLAIMAELCLSLAACPRKAAASINGVRSSWHRSISNLPNVPITFSQVYVVTYAAETFSNWILWRLMSVIWFAVRRFSFQTSLFIYFRGT